MNIQPQTSFEYKFICNIAQSDDCNYLINKGLLSHDVSAHMFDAFNRYHGLDRLFSELYKKVKAKDIFRGRELYCFLTSFRWQLDSRIVRYYKLDKFLFKYFDGLKLDFLFQNEILREKEVLFYGVVKLSDCNIVDVLELVSRAKNGILFTYNNYDNACLERLAKRLTGFLRGKTKIESYDLDLTCIVNYLTSINEIVVYPYDWHETGTAHLDIYERNEAFR